MPLITESGKYILMVLEIREQFNFETVPRKSPELPS